MFVCQWVDSQFSPVNSRLDLKQEIGNELTTQHMDCGESAANRRNSQNSKPKIAIDRSAALAQTRRSGSAGPRDAMEKKQRFENRCVNEYPNLSKGIAILDCI